MEYNHEILLAMGFLWGVSPPVELICQDNNVRLIIPRPQNHDILEALITLTSDNAEMTVKPEHIEFLGIQPDSYLLMGMNRELTVWMEEASGTIAQSFLDGFNTGISEPQLTEDHPYPLNQDQQSVLNDLITLTKN